MVLGLLRTFVLTIVGVVEAYRRNPDKIVQLAGSATGRPSPGCSRSAGSGAARPVYSTLSLLFHVGLAAGAAVPGGARAAVEALRRAWRGRRFRRLRPTGSPWLSWSPGWGSSPAAWRSAQLAQAQPLRRTSPGRCCWSCRLSPAMFARTLAVGPKAYHAAMLLHVYSADLDHGADSVHQDCALRSGAAVADWLPPSPGSSPPARATVWRQRWATRTGLSGSKTPGSPRRRRLTRWLRNESRDPHRHHQVHRLPRMRGRLQEAEPSGGRRAPPLGRWTTVCQPGTGRRSWTARNRRFVRKQCRHCLEPACASACPGRRPAQDRDRRGGLRQQQVHGLPLLHDGLPLRHSALRLGRLPCPTSASAFCATTASWQGVNRPAPRRARPRRPSSATATGLLAEAHRRIRDNPGLYVDKVWGEQDVGGTSVLYISNVDLSFLSNEAGAGHRAAAVNHGAWPWTPCRLPSARCAGADGGRELDHRPAHEASRRGRIR